ncbi:NADPH:quinone oxidoreductase family protein [Seohaeicola saemankumensis]|uniref:NADPH:quinone oxidoreductase family protein n=1 Tax=Seohaeicola saemankumensis TaxID=481181 RepID=UPI001E533756|nr:NADPH:quinone oxidoreductase family protein [Seohaeicola saemankumensis]MCD1628190.1 NADPH:quinone oxidoreductase family protein [Seohaeicola saemankumensis]
MSLPKSMKALVLRDYAGWQSAAVEDVPLPVPGERDVLIEVAAASLNFADLLMMEGKYQVKPDLPFIAGRDAAGVVVAAGPGVTGFKVGDRVCTQDSTGAFAEYDCSPDWSCTVLPPEIGFEDAAACATAIATMAGAMKLRADLKLGQSVIITGATGGVGSMAIQYALLLGVRPIAVVSNEEKATLARSLGAEAVVLTAGMADPVQEVRLAIREQGFHHVDAIIDMVGGNVGEGALRCARPGGRYVIVGFASGDLPALNAGYLLVKDVMVFGSSLQRLMRARDPELTQAVHDAFAALAVGKLKSQIDEIFPLSDFAAGFERMAGRQALGKVVFSVGAAD